MDSNIQKEKNTLFTLSYSLVLFSIVYTNTYLPFTETNFVMYIGIVLATIIISLKIILYDLPEINFKNINILKITLIILFVIATFITLKNKYLPPLLVFLFVIGARKIDFKQVIKVYIRVVGFVLLMAIIASALGLIINSKVTRDGVLRQGFGYKYPTAFVNILNTVFIAELYKYFCYKNIKIGGIVIRDFIYLLAAFITLYLSDTRADSAITFILIPISVYLYFKYKNNEIYLIPKISKFLTFLFSVSFFMFGLLSYCVITVFIKNPSQPFLNNLDVLLSRRLSLTAYAVQHYGYSFLGKKIISGDLVNGQYTFYLDSSYFIFFIGYGILLFLLVGIIYYHVLKRELSYGNIAFAILIIILAFMGLIEEHFYAVETNPFLLATMAITISPQLIKTVKK